MRESRLMLLQYVTAIVAVALVAFHLLMQGVLVPYGVAISFDQILSVYRNWLYAGFLEVLLVVVLIHGFNGLRIILQELRQTSLWARSVDIGTLLAIVATVVYGTRTIVIAIFGGTSA